MYVGLAVHGQVVVDDVLHIGYVQASCCKVGADKHIGATALEAEQGTLPVLLLHGSVEGADAETCLVQELIDAVNGLAIVEEHDAGGAAQRAEQTTESLQLVLLGRTEQVLADAVGIVGIGVGKIVHPVHPACTHEGGYLRAVGGREQYALPYRRQEGKYVGHLLTETKFEGLVELVDYEGVYLRAVEITFLEVVKDTAGSAYDHLGREAAHGAVLVHGRTAAIAGIGLRVAAEAGCHTLCLDGKLSAWHQHKHRGHRGRLHRLHNGEHVAQCLATAGGRKQHQGVVLANTVEHLLLHGIQGLDT